MRCSVYATLYTVDFAVLFKQIFRTTVVGFTPYLRVISTTNYSRNGR